MDNNIVYAASTQDGVYLTADGGTSWKAANTGLLVADISHFSRPFFIDDTTYFCASTSSGSTYITEIYNPVTSINAGFNIVSQLSVLGNPSPRACKFEITVDKQTSIKVNVYSVDGQLIHILKNIEVEKGKNYYEINLKPGIFILQAEINGSKMTDKIVIY